jgi:alpha-tubulin suppressor-like RCC1 family protein
VRPRKHVSRLLTLTAGAGLAAALLLAGADGDQARATPGVPGATADSGAAVAFGDNTNGRTNAPPLPAGMTYTAAATGNFHTVLLRSDGTVAAFGGNTAGQTNVPPLPAGMTYTALAAGLFHTVLLRSDGTVTAFGDNAIGQIDVPALPAGVTYTAIAANNYNTVLLRSDGTVAAFGNNGLGQTDVPALPAGTTYIGVAAGGLHTVLLRSDGTVVAFGYNGAGQADVPALPAGVTYTAAAAGGVHTVLLRSDGTVAAFGDNTVGQTTVPALPAGVTYTAAAAGSNHTVLLRSDGTVAAFGYDNLGQTTVPALPAGATYTAVAAGGDHTVLLRASVPTSAGVSVASSPVAVAETAGFTATVTPAPAAGMPYTGSVLFDFGDGSPSQTVAVDPDSGTAGTSHAFAAPGTYDVTAAYTGGTDGSYRASAVSAPGIVTILGPTTTLRLTPGTASATAGDSVAFMVAGEDAAGSPTDISTGVSFAVDAVPATGPTTTFTRAGAHTVTATLDADPGIQASATVTVSPARPAAIQLTLSATTVDQGATIAATTTSIDAYGNDSGAVAVTLSSDHAGDEIDQATGTIRFPGASVHVITATSPGLTAASVPVTVNPATMATTGAEASPLVALSATLLGVGGLIVVLCRRRPVRA